MAVTDMTFNEAVRAAALAYLAGGGGGGGAGTSNTTEATQLLVKEAVESTAANGALEATQELVLAELQSQLAELPKTPLMETSDLAYAFNSSSLSSERSLVAATILQTTKGYRMVVTAAAATTFDFLDGSGGAALYTLEFPAAGAYVLDLEERPYFKGTANTALFVKSSNAVKTTVALSYVQGA